MSDAVNNLAPDKKTILQEEPKNPIDVVMEYVPEERKKEAADAVKHYQAMVVMQSESFEGPIPSPAVLKEYEVILPGAADRIISMAEKQSEHRMSLEKKAIGGQVDQNKRGQLFAFILAVICIIAAFLFALFLDMKEFAAKFLTGTMVVLVALFITGKLSVITDLKKKSKDKGE